VILVNFALTAAFVYTACLFVTNIKLLMQLRNSPVMPVNTINQNIMVKITNVNIKCRKIPPSFAMREDGEPNCLGGNGLLADGNDSKLLTDKGPETTNNIANSALI